MGSSSFIRFLSGTSNLQNTLAVTANAAASAQEKKRLAAERAKAPGQRARERDILRGAAEQQLNQSIEKNGGLGNGISGIQVGDTDSNRFSSEDITPKKKKKTNTVSSAARPSILNLAGIKRKSILGTEDTELGA